MPQESLKSVVYRSFVTCDDPKGVVECGTVRRPKKGSGTMEKKIERQRASDSKSKTSLAHKVDKEKTTLKGTTEEFQGSPSSLQLMEVSREALKLNEMIDSWSKGLNYDGQSKDIAKDLLKGALDLQDSLVMLGKLQEASRYMAKLKKKQKGKSGRGKVSEVGIERSNLDQLGDQTGFQKPRLSADGSSRDCYEELRSVIRESFVKQNLLPNTITEEKNLFHKNLDSAFRVPFTSSSSSQSSILEPLHYSSTESSASSSTPPMKVKSPNLIAKLMGLEEFPSKPLQSTAYKQSETEKIPNQRWSMFDIDRPKFRKPSFVVQKENRKHRTLKEILDTMQFKGLLRSNPVEELKPQPFQLDDSDPKQRMSDDNPPIVLIKPLYAPHLESEAANEPSFQKEEAPDTKMIARKPIVKEQFPSKDLDHKKGSINSKKTNRKMEAEEIPTNKPSQEGAKDHKDVYVKPEEKDGNAKKKASGRAKGMMPPQPQRREAIQQKTDKGLKAAVTSKIPVEKGPTRAKNVPRIQYQVKVTPARAKIPENGSNIGTKQVSREQSSISSKTSNCTTRIRVHNYNDGKRRLTRKEKPESDPPVIAEECKEDEKMIDLVIENDCLVVNCTPADHPKESELLLGECCSTSESSVRDNILLNSGSEAALKTVESSMCDDMLLNSENEEYRRTGETCTNDDVLLNSENEDFNTVEEVSNHFPFEADNKGFDTETSLKALLLSAPDFLSHAKELFDFSVNGGTCLQTIYVNDSLISDQKLSIDCANELTERRSLPDSRVVLNPLLERQKAKFRTCISLDQLLKEVCNGVEALKSYSTYAGKNYPTDSLYVMLERDMRCGGLASGMWEMGWKNGFSLDDTERVVHEVEKLIFSGLIEEVFS